MLLAREVRASSHGDAFCIVVWPKPCSLVCAMASSKRTQKLAQLDGFRRCVPQCSVSALCAILRKAQDGGIPDLTDRWAAAEAQQWKMQRGTPNGPLQRSIQVGGMRVEVINPAALLWVICKDGGRYSDMVRNMLRHRPPPVREPWRLAIYSDEVTPGNVSRFQKNGTRPLFAAQSAASSVFRVRKSGTRAVVARSGACSVS